MESTASQSNAANSSATAQTEAARETILAKGRSVLDAESAAIADARARLDDTFVEAVRAIFAAEGRFDHAGTYRSPSDPHERVMHFVRV